MTLPVDSQTEPERLTINELDILLAIKARPLYTKEIRQAIAFGYEVTTLPPLSTITAALKTLKAKGLVTGTWGTAVGTERRKYYALTQAGQDELQYQLDLQQKLLAYVSPRAKALTASLPD